MRAKQPTDQMKYYGAGIRALGDLGVMGWTRDRSSFGQLSLYELIYRLKPRKPV
ncbi:hypothetical protein [Membranihabitans maritimus]|uniref:hypothetical protein n=1 Tax=Membranihabitans maritimus TaxID=2904244 RepID=UPI001F31F8EB|nr:hypothetical protein [Membranihabitans maritimus]